MRGLLAATLGACVLTACSAPPGKLITEDQLPHVKPGLWEEVAIDNGTAMTPSQDCSDGTLHLPGALMPAGCDTGRVMRLMKDGAVAVEWSCSAKGVTTLRHTTVSGDFKDSYGVADATITTPSGAPPQVMTLGEGFKYLGACPPDSGPAAEGPD